MCLPPPSEGLAKGYFERMYQVNELTSFDNLFSSEMMNPISATSASSAKMIRKSNRIDENEEEFDVNTASLYKNPNPQSTTALPTAKRISVSDQIPGFRIEEDVDLGPAPIANISSFASSGNLARGFDDVIDVDAEVSGPLAANKASGFQLGKYVREIGIKARTLVGGFLRKDDQILLNSIPQESFKKEGGPSDSQWDWNKHDFSHANSMIYQSPGYSYIKYAEISNNTLLMMGDKMPFLTSPEEYASSIRECNIDVDDVSAMEKLATDCYLSSIIPNGIYTGMERKESAVGAQGFICSSMNMIETELQGCLDTNDIFQEQTRVHLDTEDSIQVSSPNPKEKTSQRRGSKSEYIKRKGSYDLVPFAAKRHLKRLISQAKAGPGLEDELLSNANQYLQQQSIYADQIDVEKLSRRMSSLTVEKSILEYARLLDKDSVASSVDDITFMASDDPQYQSFSELQNILYTLAPLTETYAAKANELKVIASKTTIETDTKKDKQSRNPLSLLSFKRYKMKTSKKKEAAIIIPIPIIEPTINDDDFNINNLAKSRISTEYDGFTLLASDLYSRISNPLLSMNEIAVIAWNRSHSKR